MQPQCSAHSLPPAIARARGAEIDTLTVGSTSLTDPGRTVRLAIRDFETNRPALPRD